MLIGHFISSSRNCQVLSLSIFLLSYLSALSIYLVTITKHFGSPQIVQKKFRDNIIVSRTTDDKKQFIINKMWINKFHMKTGIQKWTAVCSGDVTVWPLWPVSSLTATVPFVPCHQLDILCEHSLSWTHVETEPL